MAKITIQTLLDAGCHYGHQTRRWNPKMKPFIFGERNGIYILDLKQTMLGADKAYTFLKETAAKGGTVLFVGTKKQAQEPIAAQAERCGMPYINQRWLGGMTALPQAIFVVDSKREEIAIREANRLHIPVVSLLDTNSDPDVIDYGVPANDDAIRSVSLMCELAADAVLAGSGKEQITAAEMEAGTTEPAVEAAPAEAPAAE